MTRETGHIHPVFLLLSNLKTISTGNCNNYISNIHPRNSCNYWCDCCKIQDPYGRYKGYALKGNIQYFPSSYALHKFP